MLRLVPGEGSPLTAGWMRPVVLLPLAVATRMPVEFVEALLAHETQVDPNGPERSCPLEIEQRAWPTEDYHLVRSLVDTALPEDDLFAGVVPAPA